MTDYIRRQRTHLIQQLERLQGPDVEIYFRDGDDAQWGILYFPDNQDIMSISYDNVMGISLGTCLKPDRMHGTGYSCLDVGYRFITRQDMFRARQLGAHLLAQDVMNEARRQGKFIMTQADIDSHRYKNIQEYLDTYGKNWTVVRFEEVKKHA